MNQTSHKLKVAAVFAAAVIIPAGLGYWALTSHKAQPKTTTTTTTQTATNNLPSAAALKAATVDETDFKYQKPEDWAKLAKERLDSVGATSGIGHPLAPLATFIVKTTAALPNDDADLKNSTLNELKKLTSFALVSNASVKVGGKTGQKFIYTFTDTDKTKVKAEMDVVPNKKTFFLLFSSAEPDYDKSSKDFAAILASFTFK